MGERVFSAERLIFFSFLVERVMQVVFSCLFSPLDKGRLALESEGTAFLFIYKDEEAVFL